MLCLWKSRPLHERMSQCAPAPDTRAAIEIFDNCDVNKNIPIICSIAQLMRVPVSFSSLKRQAIVATGAAASFFAHRLLIKIPHGEIREIYNVNNNTQLFRTVSGELVKPHKDATS